MSFSKFKIIVTAGFEKPKIISEDCKYVYSIIYSLDRNICSSSYTLKLTQFHLIQ